MSLTKPANREELKDFCLRQLDYPVIQINVDETSVAYMWTMSGRVTLPGALDRVRITTVNGTDAFDAGSINVMYE